MSLNKVVFALCRMIVYRHKNRVFLTHVETKAASTNSFRLDDSIALGSVIARMATPEGCIGHRLRDQRKDKIKGLQESSMKSPNKNLKVLIKKGPISVETSLNELEENYESKPEWKMIEDGGVLSIPVEELRMVDSPKPDHSGHIAFDKKKGGKGTKVEDYTVGQTIEHLNALVLSKYNEEKEQFEANGSSESESERFAVKAAQKLPLLCTAVP